MGGDLLLMLPEFYREDPVMRGIMTAHGDELAAAAQAIDDVFDQFFVNTATWGIEKWERELGIAPMPGEDIAVRRYRVLSKLRGFGTATVKVVKAVASSYEYGAVEVIEDHPAYTVIIRFVDTTGVPPKLDELKAALRAVVPAHLDIIFELNYFTWDNLDAMGWTWDALDALALTWDQLERYK